MVCGRAPDLTNSYTRRDDRARASGFGIHGGKGRCYDVWMDFSECISRCSVPGDCAALREDYFECLHHRKEYSRINAINKEREKRAALEMKGTEERDSGGHH